MIPKRHKRRSREMRWKGRSQWSMGHEEITTRRNWAWSHWGPFEELGRAHHRISPWKHRDTGGLSFILHPLEMTHESYFLHWLRVTPGLVKSPAIFSEEQVISKWFSDFCMHRTPGLSYAWAEQAIWALLVKKQRALGDGGRGCPSTRGYCVPSSSRGTQKWPGGRWP